jgi:mRNA interferase MazF
VICERLDVVLVPFPFVERAGAKRRPALVLSARSFNCHGHTVLAMITTAGQASWPGDVGIADLAAAGLPAPSLVRLKLFTLDNRFLLRRLGHLSESDMKSVIKSLRLCFG